jgi:hypothetical protein
MPIFTKPSYSLESANTASGYCVTIVDGMGDTSTRPEETCRVWLRRKIKTLSGLDNPGSWLVERGIWLFLIFAAIYVVGGYFIGWGRAYSLLIGGTAPSEVPYAGLAWLLSLIGWLFIPAVIGGFAGYMLGHRMEMRRSDDLDTVLEELRKQGGGGSQPPPPSEGS